MRIAIYWLFASFIAIVLGLGWLSQFSALTDASRNDLFNLHISLAETAAVLILAVALLRSLFLLLFHSVGDGQLMANVLGDRFFPILF
ncbi:MAG: hypothetical protein FWD08_07625, partial [Alphaproteobacteria bacterium]|nr:hypothetical protein [Alphaproteobacteria bacterium]